MQGQEQGQSFIQQQVSAKDAARHSPYLLTTQHTLHNQLIPSTVVLQYSLWMFHTQPTSSATGRGPYLCVHGSMARSALLSEHSPHTSVSSPRPSVNTDPRPRRRRGLALDPQLQRPRRSPHASEELRRLAPPLPGSSALAALGMVLARRVGLGWAGGRGGGRRSGGQGSGSRVRGLGFRVQGPGFRVQGVQGPGSRVQGPGFRVQGSGFRVQGLGSLEGLGDGLGPTCGLGGGHRPRV